MTVLFHGVWPTEFIIIKYESGKTFDSWGSSSTVVQIKEDYSETNRTSDDGRMYKNIPDRRHEHIYTTETHKFKGEEYSCNRYNLIPGTITALKVN